VNDAPALKRADIGIAVFPATDAAKAAADIVLTESGLSVIIDAIFRSRKIFQRMRNYCIYRISCTIQLLFFFFFAIMTIDPEAMYFYGAAASSCDADHYHGTAFTLPVISLVIITILNDGTMITIAHDKVIPERRPQRWAMTEVTIVSIVLGMVACLSSLILLFTVLHANATHPGGFIGAVLGSQGRDFIRWQEAETIIYLKISLSDFLTLFSARTRVWFWERRPGYALGLAAMVATACSTLLSLFWDDIINLSNCEQQMVGLRNSQYAVVAVWIYCILWFFAQDMCKVLCYHFIESNTAEDVERVREVTARGQVAAMIDDDRRRARQTGKPVGREISFAGSAYPAGGSGDPALQGKVDRLEREVAELRSLIKGAAAAGSGGAGSRGH
jgi:H+-transporting ATPase